MLSVIQCIAIISKATEGGLSLQSYRLLLQIMLPSVCLIILAALLIVQVNAHTHDELSEQYTYSVQLDTAGNYTMFYSYDEASSILRIAVRVQTNGWIGLGISPNSQMPGSDVVIGWVDESGTPFLQVTDNHCTDM